ncbi:hypothetical protein NHX12_011140 [Muraenolepis orangiensis]|uniref:SAP domain-containing protein n=1 Tax=Muraenolepis orangiensis TaxID=630683 RepID=A0A9Q0DFJ9_9TELE|nr:hypothetical protein NHX12_011140 [Muraenolepis orangiensis]
MKLSEIKKCKVPELRSKLKGLGLDPRGLKTELIGRLWSALEAGLQHRDDDDHHRTAARKVDEARTQNDPIDVTSTSPPPITGTMTSSGMSHGSVREYADTGTQTTDTPPSLPSTPLETCREEEEEGGNASVEPPLSAIIPTAPDVGDREFRWADSSHVPVSQDEEEEEEEEEMQEESQSWHGEEEGGCKGMARDPTTSDKMGRAFYEFKEEIRYKRAKYTQQDQTYQKEGEVVEEDDVRVRIDRHASDLQFEVDPDGSSGRPLFCERFPLLWSGCRLTHGVQRGASGTSFEVRLERKAHASGQAGEEPQSSPEPHGLRVGWALDNSHGPLGEAEWSFAYDGCGRKVSGGQAEEFGEPLSDGDIIGCYLLFSRDGAAEMSFHKNGRPMGVAFRPGPSTLGGHTLFPHVLCQGCSVRFHLDPAGGPWYPGPPGFTPLAALPGADRVRAPAGPSSRTQCEVIVMVGLPGSGKSHWARILMEQNPEKRYQLLGTETLLVSMILIKMAARKPGNYILDQPNIFVSARRHKLRLFGGFQRRLVAVVFPPAAEWTRRLALRRAQGGERIPDTALLKLQVSYSLPEQQGEPFEELRYVELPQEEAQVLLHSYREEARRLLPPAPQPQKKARVRKNRAFGPPPSHGNQWKRRCVGNDNRFHGQAWRPQPTYWDPSHLDQRYYYNTAVGYSGYPGHW